MTDITVTSKDLASIKVDAIVLGTCRTAKGVELVGGNALPRTLRSSLAAALTPLGVTGKPDDVHRVPAGSDLAASIIVLTGLGERTTWSPETLRRAAGAATRTATGIGSVAIALPTEDADALGAIAEGALLGAYSFAEYKTTKDSPAPANSITIVSAVKGRAVKPALARADVVAKAVRAVRNLVNTPPLDLYPAAFADYAKEQAKGSSVKIHVYDEKALAAGGYGGLLGVGQGSTRPPRLVKVSYTAARAAAKVALVGKGITFDSGGLSLKPPTGMITMKSDMAGAATVLHTVLAAAELRLPVSVTGYLALAENMPSGTAQRPSDVIAIRGGKTVEVLNTDAEGRLVLADGLVAAAEGKPDVAVDIATLTGAQVVALGTRVGAVMGTEEVRADIVAAAEECGEQFWPMPLPNELRASLDSKIADIANIGERNGGMLVAGLFLKEFVGDVPWAHLDIAGPSFNEGAGHGYTPAGGTGVGLRTLLEFISGQARKR